MRTVFKTTEQLIKEKDNFLSVIPNKLGINLCSVKGIEYKDQANGELVSIRIDFIPEEVEQPDYQQRVFDEASELAKKIDKLRPFINSEKFASVDKQEQIRMIQQLGYMTSYLKILKDRMDSFK